jgi:CTP:molybdopterin cytidylyltransferase MocA
MLAEIDGEPILRRVTKTFCSAGLDELLVVLPSDEGNGLKIVLKKVIEDLSEKVRCVENPKWQNGMFTSVKAGLAAVAAAGRSTHVAISPADLPFLSTESLRRMKNAAAMLEERTLAVPTHAGRRGHPLVLSASLIPRILSWPDDQRLSSLFEEPDLSVLHLEGFDDGILRDVDRPADLR